MHNEKLKKYSIIALALSCMFCLLMLMLPTISRYVTKVVAPYNGEEDLDYTVNSVFIVNNQDEFFAAINQGYTYLQLSKDLENPMIVTQQSQNLDADLILDLNGVEIQRNGHDPILNIKQGVKLTVVDTSDAQTGGLYNPVGSVFNIDGGNLTVVAGYFCCGPRYSEYYTFNRDLLSDTHESTKRTIVENQAQKVIFYSGDSEEGQIIDAPIIRTFPTFESGIKYYHSNLYFDEALNLPGSDIQINADTYCYYRTSEDKSASTLPSKSAEWRYTYWVSHDYYEYVGTECPADAVEGQYVQITIYGYERVIHDAENTVDPSDYYAAIQMQSGKLEVQNGSFHCYFGVEETACVNSQGGTIDIKNGAFSSRVPNALRTDDNTLIIRPDDALSFESYYFDVYEWKEGSEVVDGYELRGDRARKGESYCILNGGDANLTIEKGQFYSSNNSIVSMNGGNLKISSGVFTKNNILKGVEIPADRFTDNVVNDVGRPYYSAISMANGKFDLSNATCYIYGDNNKAIYMQNGKLTVRDCSYVIHGSDTHGIYSTLSSNTDFVVTNSNFDISEGDRQVGIYSEKGRVNISSDTANTIKIDGDYAIGINVGTGGSVDASRYVFDLNGDYATGIKTVGALNVNLCSYTLDGNNVYGIYSTVGGQNFFVKDTDFDLNGHEKQTGIYAENGQVSVDATTRAVISVDGANSNGIHVANGGSVVSNKYEYNLGGVSSRGIWSEGGNVTMDNGSIMLVSNETCYGIYAASSDPSKQFEINSTNSTISVGFDPSNTHVKPAGQTVAASIGVFMATPLDTNNITLTNVDIYSYEIGVACNGGLLNINGYATIRTNRASAIAVTSGTVKFDDSGTVNPNNENGETFNYIVRSANTRTDYSNTTANMQAYCTNSYTITYPQLVDGELSAVEYVNKDGIYVSGGSLEVAGTLKLTHYGLQNVIYEGANKYANYTKALVNSYAINVIGGKVIVAQSTINAKSGGGIACSGGEIIMGIAGDTANNSKISVVTEGKMTDDTEYYAIGTDISASWRNERSVTGGNAIDLNGGNITIHGGRYEAQFGNGVATNGGGKITINDGVFYGWMNDADGDLPEARKSGPSAHYGLKVVGGATVKIYGGIFDGGNGGAFVTGIDRFVSRTEISSSNGSDATVLIYAGEFGGDESLDGFNVYDRATVVFGAYGAGESPFGSSEDYQRAITINCDNACIAANSITQNNTRYGPKIYVYYGYYHASEAGKVHIWNDGSFAEFWVYNTQQSAGAYTTVGTAAYNENNPTTVYNTITG